MTVILACCPIVKLCRHFRVSGTIVGNDALRYSENGNQHNCNKVLCAVDDCHLLIKVCMLGQQHTEQIRNTSVPEPSQVSLVDVIQHPQSGCCIISVLSVCMYVCQMITFVSLDVGRSFLLIWYISWGYGSSLYMKVIRSRLRSQEPKMSILARWRFIGILCVAAAVAAAAAISLHLTTGNYMQA